jgi:hypothetical protein
MRDQRAGYGDCVIGSDREGRYRVIHADPRTLIDPTVLAEIVGGRASTLATYDPEHETVTIRAGNRTVVYRVGRYLPDRRGYEAVWPD